MATEVAFVRVVGPVRRVHVEQYILRTILLVFSLRLGRFAVDPFATYRAYRVEYVLTCTAAHYRFETASRYVYDRFVHYRYRSFQYLTPVGDGGESSRSGQWSLDWSGHPRLDLLPPPGLQATVCTWIRHFRSRGNIHAIVNAARHMYIRETLDATYPDDIFP